jgi:hypothetical protein
MLRMANGTTEVFTLQGLGIRGNAGGIADIKAQGQVFHLKKAADFAGTYRTSPRDAPSRTDPKALTMKNEKGVVVVLEVNTETKTYPDLTIDPSSDLTLDTSDQNVEVRLER